MRKTMLRSLALIAAGVVLGFLVSGGSASVEAAKSKIDPKVSSFCTQLAEPQRSYAPCAPGKSVFTIPSTVGTVATNVSLAIGKDGFPAIAFAGDNGIELTHCTDISCGNGKATTNIVDPIGGNGNWSVVAIGADGFPVIAYQDDSTFPNSRLKVAKCNDVACKGVDETISVVNAPTGTESVGSWNSIAIGTDGNPVISYGHRLNATDIALTVTKCDDPACAPGGETTNDVDTELGGFIRHTSIAVDRGGNPVISYSDETALGDGRLKVVACDDPACTGGGETPVVVDDQTDYVGQFTSLAIGLDDNPVISSLDGDNGDLRVTKCNDPDCAGSDETTTVAASTGTTNIDLTTLALGANGAPVISFHIDGGFKMVRCNDAGCTGGDEALLTIDPSHSLPNWSSVAIGVERDPVIAYTGTGNAVNVARVPG